MVLLKETFFLRVPGIRVDDVRRRMPFAAPFGLCGSPGIAGMDPVDRRQEGRDAGAAEDDGVAPAEAYVDAVDECEERMASDEVRGTDE